MKTCIDCGEEKPLDDFHGHKKAKDGKHSYCKECAYTRRREWDMQRLYGISIARYEEMLAEQHGRCACCGTTKPGGGKREGTFYVDHCHATGEVRGLLCHKCNSGLGALGDDLDGVMNMVYYLLQNQMHGVEVPESD